MESTKTAQATESTLETTTTEMESAKKPLPIRAIFVDMVKYMPSKLVGVLGNTILIPIYTNILTPEQYGLYAIAISTLSFLCIIFFDWIGTSGLRFFKAHQLKGDITKYFSSLLFLLGTNFILMFAAVFIFRHHITGFFKLPMHFLFFIALLIIPVAFRSLLFQMLRAQIKPSLYTILTIANQFTTIGIAVLLIKYAGWGPFGILAAMAISIVATDVALVFSVKLFSGIKFKKINFPIIKHLCWYGLPLALASLSSWIMTQSDKFIVQMHYKNSFYNGIIGVSYNMTFSIFLAMFAIIMIAAMPRIIIMYEHQEDTREATSRLSGFFIALTIPFIAFVSLYAPEYVKLMANPKFGEAVKLVPFLMGACFFTGLTEYTTIQYHLRKKTYINTIIRMIPGIIGIFLTIHFLPKFGLITVGATALFTSCLYFLLSIIVVEKDLEWWFPLKEVTMSCFALILPVCLVALLKTHYSVYPITQMLSAIVLYYLCYIGLWKFVSKKRPADLDA